MMYSRCFVFFVESSHSVRHRPNAYCVPVHSVYSARIFYKTRSLCLWHIGLDWIVWVESVSVRHTSIQHIALYDNQMNEGQRKRVSWRRRRRRRRWRRLEWISRDLIINNENASKSFLHVFKFNIFILLSLDKIDLVLRTTSTIPPFQWRHWWR